MTKFCKKDALLLSIVLFSSCTHHPRNELESIGPPLKTHTAKATSASEDKREIKSMLLKPNQKIVFASEFKHKNCSFGKVPIHDPDQLAKYNFAPATLCTVGKSQYLTRFPEAWYHYEWTHAQALPDSGHFVGILNYGIEGGLESVPVFRSNNAGRTWLHVGNIEKPHFSALIENFVFSSENVGKVFLQWEGQHLVSDTKDGGHRWSAPYITH